MTPTIALLGDVMLGRAVAERLAEVPPEEVWAPEVRELCRSCDLVICNLECCISARGEPTERVRHKPFFFRGPPQAVRSLEAIGVGAVGLANNHALDYEAEALIETLELLGEAGIAVAGAGRGESEARRGAIVEAGGRRLGLVAVSDHPREFAAGRDSPGIAYGDLRRADSRLARRRAGPARPGVRPGGGLPPLGPQHDHRAGALAAPGGRSSYRRRAPIWSPATRRTSSTAPGGAGAARCSTTSATRSTTTRSTRRLRNDLGLLAIWRPGDPEVELELVGLALDYCRTRLAAGHDAEWIAQRLAGVCEQLGTRVERTAEQRFRVAPRSPSQRRDG